MKSPVLRVCVFVCVCGQLTLEQHRSELQQSTSTHICFSAVSTSVPLSLGLVESPMDQWAWRRLEWGDLTISST